MSNDGIPASRATEIGTIGLVVSVALFVLGVAVAEARWAATGSPVVGALGFAIGGAALLVALGCVLYLADVAALVVWERVQRSMVDHRPSSAPG